jgi:hypothetical protein
MPDAPLSDVMPNPRFEPTAASVPLAVLSSLRSSAAAQAQRYAARIRGAPMHRSLVLAIMFVLATPVLPQEPPKTGRPLSKEQIEQLEAGINALDTIDSLKKSMDAMIRARGSSCIKAFGHERFCKCLNEKLAVGLSFQDYVIVMTKTKDQLKYASLSTEQKQLVDNAIEVRDQCVTSVFTRQ